VTQPGGAKLTFTPATNSLPLYTHSKGNGITPKLGKYTIAVQLNNLPKFTKSITFK
jgi:hypothetical protein